MRADCHIHIAFTGKENKNISCSVEETKEIFKRILKTYKNNNIEALRDGGDGAFISVYAKEIAEEYDIKYKTPVAAFSKKSKYGKFLGVSVDTISDFKQEFADIRKYKPDYLKIILTDIIRFNGSEDVEIFFTQEQLSYMIKTAESFGIKSMVHVNSPSAIEMALSCGADTIEHGYFINSENIEHMKESKAVFVPTLTPLVNFMKYGKPEQMTAENLLHIIDNHKTKINEAYKSGVFLAAGSDAGAMYVPHNNAYENEIKNMWEKIEDKKGFLQRIHDSSVIIFEEKK